MRRKLVAGKIEKPRSVVAKTTNVSYGENFILKHASRHDVCALTSAIYARFRTSVHASCFFVEI